MFVWEGHWKTEVEDHVDQYRNLDAELYGDKEDDPADHFYTLKAVVPQDEAAAERFPQRSMAEDSHHNGEDRSDTSAEEPTNYSVAEGSHRLSNPM